jgi:rhodanese-related sulfurtransferase
LKEALEKRINDFLILDVREKLQFDICSLNGSFNIPLEELEIEKHISHLKQFSSRLFVLCRRGNRSQMAVEILKNHGIESKDVIGGLARWSLEIDSEFPLY